MSFKNEKRFYKTSKLLLILSRIFFLLTILLSLGTLVISVIFFFIPADSTLFKIGEMISIESGHSVLKYSIPIQDATSKSMKPMMISGFLSISTSMGFISFICLQLKYILKTVLDKKPFVVNNSQRIAKIGWTVIIGSFLMRAFYTINALFIMDTVNSRYLDVQIKLPLDYIFMGVLIIILAKVFAYGNYLQDEYDATL